MEITEEETENNNYSNNNARTASSPDNIDKVAEERQARDLEAGLHPLKVLASSLLIWVCVV